MNIPDALIIEILFTYFNFKTAISLSHILSPEIQKHSGKFYNEWRLISKSIHKFIIKHRKLQYANKLKNKLNSYNHQDYAWILNYNWINNQFKYDEYISVLEELLLIPSWLSVDNYYNNILPRKKMTLNKIAISASLYSPVYIRKNVIRLVDYVYRTPIIMTMRIRARPNVAALVY
tara:strand:+ start:567 stop:1094 length:528 start_codon:yes stop_codon:yes gene_type:complete